MHLTSENCFHRFNNIDSNTISTIVQCTTAWLFQSKTIFYQYPNFTLPIYFGMNCWNYLIAGIVIIYTYQPYWLSTEQQRQQQTTTSSKPFAVTTAPRITVPSFPYYTFAFFLIVIQSPLSFLADYVYMNEDSTFHIIDRIVAIPLMTLECYKVFCMWYYNIALWRRIVSITTPTTTISTKHNNNTSTKSNVLQMITYTNIVYTVGTMLAIVCFLYSQEAQSQKNLDGFIIWHNRWHMYPMYASFVTLYDYYYVLPMVLQYRKQEQQYQRRNEPVQLSQSPSSSLLVMTGRTTTVTTKKPIIIVTTSKTTSDVWSSASTIIAIIMKFLFYNDTNNNNNNNDNSSQNVQLHQKGK